MQLRGRGMRPVNAIASTSCRISGILYCVMTKKLTRILDELVDSFHKYGGINHLDGANLPSREAVVELARDLLRLMFPGFYDKDPLHSNQLIEYTNELVASVARRLENEIHRSLEYRPGDDCDPNALAGTATQSSQGRYS